MAFKGGVVIGPVNLNDTGTATTSIGGTTGTGAINIGTSTGDQTIQIGFGLANKTIRVGVANGTSSTAIESGSGGVSVNSVGGTGTLSSSGNVTVSSIAGNALVSSAGANSTTVDCGTGGANFGTTANAHITTLGSTNTTSSTVVQSGTTGIGVTATNGPITINSGTGIIGIASDATVNTVNISGGAAAKTLNLGSTNTTSITTVDCGTGGAFFGASANAHQTTVGSTNSTSATTVQYGTGDFNIASATGNVMVAQDTGEINYPLQPAFSAFLSGNVTNVTGDGTAYTILPDTEIFDQNSDFDTGTGTFTAPVAGKYYLCAVVSINGLTVAWTNHVINIVTSNRSYRVVTINPGTTFNSGGLISFNGGFICDMDAGDTATVTVTTSGSTKTLSVIGNAGAVVTGFGGNLVC